MPGRVVRLVIFAGGRSSHTGVKDTPLLEEERGGGAVRLARG